jgi:hypothetical protein
MADNYDPHLQAGARAWNAVLVDKSQADADYTRAFQEGDDYGMIEARRRISNCNAELRNLNADYQEYVAANTPPPPPTEAEIQAMPVQNMTHDQWFKYLAKTTKHGVDVDGYRQGMAEVQRRRARGE